MNRESLTRGLVLVGLVALAVAVRRYTPWPNFNAVTAAALFAGFFFRHRLAAAWVPLAALVISDYFFLGGYSRPVMLAVYGSFLLPLAGRAMLRSHASAARIGGLAAGSSLAFFLITNAAVWYFHAWYPHTWEGLARCYAVALPFFGYALAGDLLFSAAFFGSHALALNANRFAAAARAHVDAMQAEPAASLAA